MPPSGAGWVHEVKFERRIVDLRVADVGAKKDKPAVLRKRLELADAGLHPLLNDESGCRDGRPQRQRRNESSALRLELGKLLRRIAGL